MVTIRQALEAAEQFARAALGMALTTGMRLEEVDSTFIAGEEAWQITLSMYDSREPSDNIAALLGNHRREYKIFLVLKGTGDVAAMKIRELAA